MMMRMGQRLQTWCVCGLQCSNRQTDRHTNKTIIGWQQQRFRDTYHCFIFSFLSLSSPLSQCTMSMCVCEYTWCDCTASSVVCFWLYAFLFTHTHTPTHVRIYLYACIHECVCKVLAHSHICIYAMTLTIMYEQGRSYNDPPRLRCGDPRTYIFVFMCRLSPSSGVPGHGRVRGRVSQ